MSENCEIAIQDSQKESKVDFQCLIQSAVRQEISWKTLMIFLSDLTTSTDESIEVIKMLVEELEIWVEKAKGEVSTVRDNSSINEISIENVESDQITLTSTPVKNNSQNEGLVNLESEDEVIVLDLELSGNSSKSRHDIAEVEEVEEECNDITESNNQSEQYIEKLKNFYEFIGDNKEQVAKPSIKGKHNCKICGKVFSRKLYLRTHERTHTGEKPFQCKTCLKSFARSNSLTMHTRIHTGEKPYNCKTCHASFAQSTNLKKHERQHTGEKPFKCQTCFASFTQSGTLKIHERTHTGEKPFKCQTCRASFTQSGKLKAHERIHNRI